MCAILFSDLLCTVMERPEVTVYILYLSLLAKLKKTLYTNSIKANGENIMNLTQLNYFREVVEKRSFTGAANTLFISQSTLSKSIRALEEEYKVILINRGAKEFEVTEEGKILYTYAVRILDYYEQQTEELAERLRHSGSSLHLGLPPTAGAIYFYSIIHKFQKLYPEIDLQIEETTSKEIIEKVANGRMDAGVIIEPFSDNRFEKRRVFTSEAVLLVSKQHRLAKKRSVDFKDIRQERILMINSNYMYYDLVKEKCLEAGFMPQFAFESYQWEFIFEMVANDQGVTILPKPLIDKFNNARVHQVHLENPEFEWALSVIRRKDKAMTTSVQCLWNICGQTAKH